MTSLTGRTLSNTVGPFIRTVLCNLPLIAVFYLGGSSAVAQVPFAELYQDEAEEQAISDLQRDWEEAFGIGVEEDVEDSIEEVIEEEVAEVVDEEVEEAVEEAAESEIEDSIEEVLDEQIEEVAQNEIDERIEDAVEEQSEEALEESLQSEIEEQIEEAVAEVVEESIEGMVEEGLEEQVADAMLGRMESRIDRVMNNLDNSFDFDEEGVYRDQWLVMAEPGVFDRLASEGYLFNSVVELPSMDLRLAQVAAPSSFEISEIRKGVIEVLGEGNAAVDMNHFYTASVPGRSEGPGIAPRDAMHFPADTDDLELKIGMIDSQVDTSHPALDSAQITSRSFIRSSDMPSFHGTAIASIIAADDEAYQGLAPNSELYAAGVFEEDQEHGVVASTISMVRALDWLMSSGVEVINISLAGPPNKLLERALDKVANSGVTVLAAAGNGGPVAQPMYPAAYSSVVAVTAVDSEGKVFRLANRGEYLDVAAPGVNLVHADVEGGYATSSGTSFAVPFAATAAARLRMLEPEQDVMAALLNSAEDLGPPGRDEIYGLGLLKPAADHQL